MWKRQLLSVGWNDTTNSLQYLKLERITPHIKCFQIAQLAIGNLLPNMTKLAISLGDKLAEKLKQFFRFGSFMHLYIRSSIKPIYDLAEIYEKEETVDFISFMDLDDILIPRRGSSYIDEFSAIFAASSDLAFITYDKQNIQALSDKNPKLFSLQQIYSTLKFTKFNETGKIVARPELINATWIHWPHMPANSISIPWEDNAIVHMSNIKVISEKFTIMPDQDVIAPKYVFSKGKLTVLSKLDIAEMDKDMKRILSKKKAQKILIEIPQTTLYYDIISQCFQRTFYSFHYSNRIAEMKCPNPDRCQLPNNVKRPCSHATADYHSVLGKDINVHFGVNLRFEHHDRCLY
ncbi:hypothetical protein WR25_21504 [Diploscapter pachys]|uniref:Glycosyltransferase family 92 protein n=1 Tax=Diploscapter pachys TaxID=2018661 RepID=A0A2A2KDJ7_9BILA|nr:hypothetical protein WR25_21504 [Diploscapter pachys]